MNQRIREPKKHPTDNNWNVQHANLRRVAETEKDAVCVEHCVKCYHIHSGMGQ